MLPPQFACFSQNRPSRVQKNSDALTGAPVASYVKFRCAARERIFRKRSIPSLTHRRLSEWRTLLRTCFLRCLLICCYIISWQVGFVKSRTVGFVHRICFFLHIPDKYVPCHRQWWHFVISQRNCHIYHSLFLQHRRKRYHSICLRY